MLGSSNASEAERPARDFWNCWRDIGCRCMRDCVVCSALRLSSHAGSHVPASASPFSKSVRSFQFLR